MRRDPLNDLYCRPGFMIRRAHQIAVSVFMEETADLRVTTTQFGILYLLKYVPAVDQVTAARLLGLDRSTTGMVVKALESANLIVRVVDKMDKRRRYLTLTPAGLKLFQRLETPAKSARRRLLAPLNSSEQAALLRLLRKLNAAFNETSRVPLIENERRERRAGAGKTDSLLTGRKRPARGAISR